MHRNEIALFSERTGILRYEHKSIQLSNQCAACLLLLLQNTGDFVTKELILEKCWYNRGIRVSDVSVRQTLFILRKKLVDAGLDANCLTTVPRKGYQLLPGWIALSDNPHSNDDEGQNTPPDNATMTAEKVAAENASATISVNCDINHDNISRISRLLSWCNHKKYYIQLIFVSVALSVFIFSYQLSRGVTPVKYSFFDHIDGAQIFLQDDADINKDITRMAISWLSAKRYISVDINRYIYVNRVFTSKIMSAFVCNRPMDDKYSTCYSLILEDRQ